MKNEKMWNKLASNGKLVNIHIVLKKKSRVISGWKHIDIKSQNDNLAVGLALISFKNGLPLACI